MVASRDATPSTETPANERRFLVLLFIIGSSYSYGPLLNYPLYLALSAAKGQEVVDPGVTGAILMITKLASMFVHAFGGICGTELRPTQARVFATFAVSAFGLVLAASPRVSGVWVLLGVNGLNFIISRALASTLFTVPSEERNTRRSFVHETSHSFGCLWTALVIYLLQRPSMQESWLLRALALTLPLIVFAVAWALVQPDSFYSPARMEQAEKELQQGIEVAHCVSTASERSVGFVRSLPVSLPSMKCGMAAVPQMSSTVPLMASTPSSGGLAMTPAGTILRIPTGTTGGTEQNSSSRKNSIDLDLNKIEIHVTETGSNRQSTAQPTVLGNVHQKPPMRFSEVLPAHQIQEEESIPQKPWMWRNARVRVIATSEMLAFWCMNFYMFTVLPGLIAETGPPLSVVSTLYTVEGLVNTMLMAPMVPFMRSNVHVKYFGSTWAMVILPVIGIGFLGQIHWVFYVLTLLCMDLLCAINSTTLGVILLRCLPWDAVGPFYAQVAAIGGCVYAAANLQVSLRDVVGDWPATCAIGHAVPAVLAALVYATHREALGEIVSILAKPEGNTDEMEEAMKVQDTVSLAPGYVMHVVSSRKSVSHQSSKTSDEAQNCPSEGRVQASESKQMRCSSEVLQKSEGDLVPLSQQEVHGQGAGERHVLGASTCKRHGHRAERSANVAGCTGCAIAADALCRFVMGGSCSSHGSSTV